MRRARHHTLGALVVVIATTGALVAQSGNPPAQRSALPHDTNQTAAHTANPPAATHPENPPPAYTGGFGEPTCQECHFDSDVNAGSGSLALEGLPTTVHAGTTYRLTIRLAQPDIAVAGFMLSARTADGAQAGTLRATDERTAITMAGDVAYAHHTRPGTHVDSAAASWTLAWIADGVSAGDSVQFHLVGNAGNDDESPFGDFIYAVRRQVPVESGEKGGGG